MRFYCPTHAKFVPSRQRFRKRNDEHKQYLTNLTNLLNLHTRSCLILLLCVYISKLNGYNLIFFNWPRYPISVSAYAPTFLIPRCRSYTRIRNLSKIIIRSNIQSYTSTTEGNSIKTLHDVNNDDINGSNSDLCLDRDHTQQGLVSHAPESFYVIDASMQRLRDAIIEIDGSINNEKLMQLAKTRDTLNDVQSLSQSLVKPAYSIELNITTYQKTSTINWSTNKDLVNKRGLKINYHNNIHKDIKTSSLIEQIYWNDLISTQMYHNFSCLELSHKALKNSIKSSSQAQKSLNEKEGQLIISQLEKRLSLTMGSDLRGRTSADAAFNLALAGVQNSNHLFDSLVSIAIHELERAGQRSSFKAKYILQIIEKFAVSGASASVLLPLNQIAAANLERKKYGNKELIQLLNKEGQFGLHSDRPLLWLWRFSTRQKKIQVSSFSDRKVIDWSTIFDDPHRNLIIDTGCGMGVSLLNSAICSRMNGYGIHNETNGIEWSSCNYAGTDLNQMMVRYANGIVSRLEISDREKNLHFFNLPAEDFVSEILSKYEGKVSLVMLQFPSPYRLPSMQTETGNSQLPSSAYEGFMVTKHLLCTIAEILAMNGGSGKLLFQTKCEDVAIFVKKIALDTGRLRCVPCDDPVTNIDDVYFKTQSGKRPLRVEQWLSSQNDLERAEGFSWSSSKLVPSFARTETEVACENDGTVLHRCLFELC